MKTLPRLLALFGLALCLAAPAAAQNLDREPGYVDLSELESLFRAEPKIEVNLKGALLRMVASASRRDDPEFARLLLKLKAIHVRGYDLSRAQADEVERFTSGFSRRLEGRGWETVARVREDGERVDMLVHTDGETIAGLVVLVVSPEDDESIFVNIVGDIDPEEIGRIGSKFDIDALSGDALPRKK